MADFEEMHNAVKRATQDDIINRLRKMGVYGPADTTLPIAQEAADEIEQLRNRTVWLEKRLNIWQKVATVYAEENKQLRIELRELRSEIQRLEYRIQIAR